MPLANERSARISTYVTGFCTLLARYFPGCASRSISMRPRTEFAKGSNFRNLDLFGSGYAGLGKRSYDYDTWGLGFGSAFVRPDLVAHFLGAFSYMTPVWTTGKATFVSDSPPLLKCAFPPQWNSLMGAQFRELAGNSETPVSIWNCNHPVVRTLSGEGWKWANSVISNPDPRDYSQQLLESDRLGAWVMVLLKKSMDKVWDGIAEKDPKLMGAIWARLVESADREVNALLYWVADSTDSRLRVLSPKEWGVVRKRTEIDALLPKPEEEWTVYRTRDPKQQLEPLESELLSE